MTVSSLFHRPRAAAVLATLATTLLAAGLLSVAPGARADEAPAPAATTTPSAGRYFAIAPTRVYSSRDLHRPFAQGETRTIDLSQAFTAPASAVVINLTAADGTIASQQTAYPAGTSLPYASSLNELAGEVRANSVTVAVGQGADQNKINLHNWYGQVNMVVDVLGYFSNGVGAPGAGSAYVPLAAPVRLFDTRQTIGALTSTYPKNIGIVTLTYGSAAVNRLISSVAVNITALAPVGGGYLAVWDGSGPVPKTSSLNYRSGIATSNMTTVPVRCYDTACAKLTFSIYNAYSLSVQVVGDIVGAYMTAGTSGSLVYRPVVPTRIADSRYGRPFGMMSTHSVGGVAASTWGTGSRVAVMNVTAVRPQYSTYVTVWPNGTSQPPIANVYPANAGVMTANQVQVRLGVNNSGFKIYNNAGLLVVVIDLAGTFITDPALSSAATGTSSKATPAGAGAPTVAGAIAGS